MDDLPSPAQRRAAHRTWLEGFGFSAEDWRRIRLLAEDLTANMTPAALDDLSVPYRVGVEMPERRRWTGGKNLGALTRQDGSRVVLIYWPVTRGMEWERWERAVRARRASQS